MNVSLSAGTAIAGWMLFSVIVGGVVVLAAMAAHDAQQTAQKPVRWIWLVSLVAIIGLSVAAPLRHGTNASRGSAPVVATTSAIGFSAPTSVGLVSRLAAFQRTVVQPVQLVMQTANDAVDRVPAFIIRALPWMWLAVTASLGLVFLTMYRRIVRRVRQYPTHRIEGVVVRIAPRLGPAVVGLAPAEIVVPEWLISRTTEEQRLVVTHEAEHVHAADHWMLVAAYAAVAIMPWNPAMWYAVARLRLAVEIDCDRRVIRRGVPTNSYGALLIDLSAIPPTVSAAMPAFPGTYSHLERRLRAMTYRPSRFASMRRLIGVGLAASVFITACESKLPTSAEVERMDVASAESRAVKAGMIDTLHTTYIVDGRTVDAKEAKAIVADKIASVRVNKKASGDSTAEIHIQTKSNVASPNGNLKIVVGQRDSVSIRQNGDKAFNGVLIVDGEVSNHTDLSAIPADRIASVEVIKGAAATVYSSDPRAVNGVIVVTTKR